jgi:DNA helicase-2/ATP-dependent DNA helicase PcrA
MTQDDKIKQLAEGLNSEQREGALHDTGPCMVIAGAGAGKTRLLIYRTAILLTKGVPASQLLVVTFTNRAASEIKARLQEMVGDDSQYINAGTFHSIIFNKILRPNFDAPYLKGAGYDFTQTAILDDSDRAKLLKEAYEELPADDLMQIEDNEWSLRDFENLMAENKAYGLDCHDFLMTITPKDKEHEFKRICASIWHRYTEKCRNANGIDFDDILVVAAKFLANDAGVAKSLSDQFQYIMLDEYQDTNNVQMQIMDRIAQFHRNIMTVGDEKQSIYGFRHADIKVILDFQRRYTDAKIVNMNRNYRSNAENIRWANACAYHMGQKLSDGQLKPESKLAPKVPKVVQFENQKQEAEIIVKAIMQSKRDGVKGKEIAILYRNRNLKNEIERVLVEKGQSYMVVGDTAFYGKSEVKDALSLLRFAFRPWDSMAGLRLLKATKMGIGDQAARTAMKEDGVSTINYLKAQAEKRLKPVGRNKVGEFSASAKKAKPFLQLLQSVKESFSYGDSPAFIKEVLAEIWDIYLKPKLANAAKKSTSAEHEENISNRLENVKQVLENFQKGLESGKTPDQVLDDFAMMSEDHPDMDKDNEDKIKLMTIHASKGLEFDEVFMIGMDNATFKEDLSVDEFEEERRNVYVGITRSKKRLVLSYCTKRVVYGEEVRTDRAKFLSEMLKVVGAQVVNYAKTINTGSEMRRAG